MPTVLTFTIAPSGGDYISMTACRQANSKDLVAADEQHIYLFETFVGGLDDNDALVGYTDDATRNIILRAAPGHEWDGIDPTTGFYFRNTSTSAVLRPISTVNNIELDGVCFDGSASSGGAFSAENNGDFKSLTNVGMVDVSGDNVPLNISPTLDNVLIVSPGDDGVITASACDKVTVVNAPGRGIVTAGGSAITNSFVFGSTGNDFDDQGGTHSNNASEDATAMGTGSLTNRTSADFADFANNDFRTDTNSALATAGVGGTFIGYAVNTAPGTPIAFSGNIDDQTPNVNGEFRLDISSFFTGTITPFTFSITPPIAGVSIENVSEVVIAQPVAGTLPTNYTNIVVRGTDNNLNTADSNGFDVTWDLTEWGETRSAIEASDETSGANPPFLVNDFDPADTANDVFRYETTTLPTDGTLTLDRFSRGVLSGAADGSYTHVYEGFKNNVSYGIATNTLNVGQVTSTFNLTITGAGNDTLSIEFYDRDTKQLLETRNVTFTSDTASEVFNVAAGTVIGGFYDGATPPTTGTGVYGVTV